MCPFNTVDCLLEVTTWACLTVLVTKVPFLSIIPPKIVAMISFKSLLTTCILTTFLY